MIHEDLVRHFRSHPEPQLTPEFSVRLRRQLELWQQPRRHLAMRDEIWRWMPRVYWIAAAALVMRFVRPPAFEPAHMAVMAIVALIAALAVQRALRPARLTQILRDALLR